MGVRESWWPFLLAIQQAILAFGLPGELSLLADAAASALKPAELPPFAFHSFGPGHRERLSDRIAHGGFLAVSSILPYVESTRKPPCASDSDWIRFKQAVIIGFWFRRQTADNPGIIMSQAIMDPEGVRRFAEELQRFNRDVEARMAALQARFAALGDTWQDQEQIKFAEEFKQTMKALRKFVEISGEQTPFLLRKAQRIEEYLNQR